MGEQLIVALHTTVAAGVLLALEKVCSLLLKRGNGALDGRPHVDVDAVVGTQLLEPVDALAAEQREEADRAPLGHLEEAARDADDRLGDVAGVAHLIQLGQDRGVALNDFVNFRRRLVVPVVLHVCVCVCRSAAK